MVRLFLALAAWLALVQGAQAAPLFGAKWGDPRFGTGATVTYSIVGDGVFQAETNWGNRPGRSVGFDRFLPAGYRTAIADAFGIWSRAANIRFVEVVDGGEMFGAAGSGDIRLWGGASFEPYLAWAYYPYGEPRAGDIFVNSMMDWTLCEASGFRLDWVLAHEIGHSLGLLHDDFDFTSIMYPYYPVGQGRMNDSDRAAIQMLYGRPAEVPAPEAAGLLLVGLIGLSVARRRYPQSVGAGGCISLPSKRIGRSRSSASSSGPSRSTNWLCMPT
jgi:hypothetical protein